MSGTGTDPARPAALSAPGPARFAAPALLTDLLGNGLDAGYAEAAERRRAGGAHTGRPGARRTFELLAVVVALAAGLVIAAGWNAAHRAAPEQAVLHDQLVQRVQAAQAQAGSLEDRVRDAAAAVAALQGSALSGDANGRAVRAALIAAQVAAGTVAVSGPGFEVVLGDPSAPDTGAPTGRAGSTPASQVRVVSDTDVRDLVNVLWAAGAEAVSVNQVRITPVSAIRVAGEEILVDFQTVSSPYTVSAIGDSTRLELAYAASTVAGRFQTLAGARGLTVSYHAASSLSLPAGVVADPAYASAVPSTTTASTTTASTTTASTTTASATTASATTAGATAGATPTPPAGGATSSPPVSTGASGPSGSSS